MIVQLLDHWPDFFEPASSGQIVAGGESGGLPLLSTMAGHRSVVELERRLLELRALMPGHYRHLRGFYDAPYRCTDKPVRRKTVGGSRYTMKQRVRERVVPAWVNVRMAERSVDIIAGRWDVAGVGEPELPRPLLAKLRPLADSDGWTEAA